MGLTVYDFDCETGLLLNEAYLNLFNVQLEKLNREWVCTYTIYIYYNQESRNADKVPICKINKKNVISESNISNPLHHIYSEVKLLFPNHQDSI